MFETELVISGLDFPYFSSRDCQQQLKPISLGAMRRTIGGQLCYLGHPNFHKYHCVIECQDINAPAFNHLWLGSIVEVMCCQFIWQKVEAGKSDVTLSRPARQDGLHVADAMNQKIAFNYIDQSHLTFDQPLLGAAMIKFMPILMMRIIDFGQTYQEWQQKTLWRLELEEI